MPASGDLLERALGGANATRRKPGFAKLAVRKARMMFHVAIRSPAGRQQQTAERPTGAHVCQGNQRACWHHYDRRLKLQLVL